MADIYTSSGVIAPVILAEEIRREMLEALQTTVRVAPLVKNFDLSGVKSKSFSVPVWGTVTAASVGETTDLASTAFTPTENTITYGEAGVMTLLTDTAAETSTAPGIAEAYGRNGALAVGRLIDTDIAALFNSTNGGTNIGNDASTMAVQMFLRGIYTLELENVLGNYVSVLSSQQAHNLRLEVNSSSAITIGRFLAEKARDDGFIGNLYGVDTYIINVAEVSSATSTSKFGIIMGQGDMSPFGLGVWRPARVELERNASFRGTEVVISAAYGIKEIRDKAGVAFKAK